jgi:hypothetical protein
LLHEGPEYGVAPCFSVKAHQIGIEMKLPGNTALQLRKMSGPGGVGGYEKPFLSIFRGFPLPNIHQDFFIVDYMNPSVLGWKDFPGRRPTVRAIAGKLAEDKGATGQVIRGSGEQFEFHDCIIWEEQGKGKNKNCRQIRGCRHLLIGANAGASFWGQN